MEVRVSRVFERVGIWSNELSCVACQGNVVVAQPPMKLLLWPALDGLRWITLCQQFEQCSPQAFDLHALGLNLHTISQQGVAGCDRTRRAGHIHHAKPARARRLEAVVMTKSRYLDAALTTGGKNRCALGKFVVLAVDGHRKHSSNSFPEWRRADSADSA